MPPGRRSSVCADSSRRLCPSRRSCRLCRSRRSGRLCSSRRSERRRRRGRRATASLRLHNRPPMRSPAVRRRPTARLGPCGVKIYRRSCRRRACGRAASLATTCTRPSGARGCRRSWPTPWATTTSASTATGCRCATPRATGCCTRVAAASWTWRTSATTPTGRVSCSTACWRPSGRRRASRCRTRAPPAWSTCARSWRPATRRRAARRRSPSPSASPSTCRSGTNRHLVRLP